MRGDLKLALVIHGVLDGDTSRGVVSGGGVTTAKWRLHLLSFVGNRLNCEKHTTVVYRVLMAVSAVPQRILRYNCHKVSRCHNVSLDYMVRARID